jgi:hypothetical protein
MNGGSSAPSSNCLRISASIARQPLVDRFRRINAGANVTLALAPALRSG